MHGRGKQWLQAAHRTSGWPSSYRCLFRRSTGGSVCTSQSTPTRRIVWPMARAPVSLKAGPKPAATASQYTCGFGGASLRSRRPGAQRKLSLAPRPAPASRARHFSTAARSFLHAGEAMLSVTWVKGGGCGALPGRDV